ncbi:MAG: hypothetical protein RPU64_11880 [Candidatus Sedimenticola sp. (ex Thyasira tokunagai)]
MRISHTNEDAKLLELNRPAETRGAETRPVTALEETARPSPLAELREHDTRYTEQRRHKQRRKQQQKIQLDTRDHHERRILKRREEDRKQTAEDKKPITQGIDITA